MRNYVKRDQNEYDNNFKNIIEKYTDPKYLTTKGFSSMSEISSHSYTVVFKTNWYDLLKKYGEFDRLYQYVKNEFIEFAKLTKITSLDKFVQQHTCLTKDFLRYIDNKLFKDECKVSKKYTKEMLEDNFSDVRNKLGRVPNHSEFIKMSKIHPKTYRQFFNLSGQVWEDILRYFVSEEEINEFNTYQAEYRKQIAIAASQKEYIYSNEELEKELKIIFDYYYKEFNVYPSRRLFNKISKFHDLLYRERFNMKWSEVCKMYGYEIDTNNSKSEKIFLQLVDELLKSKNKTQKTFDWLRNEAGNKLKIDGFYQDYNLAIEFDGVHHRKPVANYGGMERYLKQVANDKIKDDLIPQHGLKLIRIDSRESWHDKDYLKQRLIDAGIEIPQIA